MKITYRLLAVLMVLCVVRVAHGQTEKIALYADAWGSDCSITDTAPGVVEVHMIHVGSVGSTGASFRAPMPACWMGAVWLGDVISPPFLIIGTTQGNFIDVAYRTCVVSPIYIGKINFYGVGTGDPCCEYPVLPSYFPTVIAVDCTPLFGPEVPIGGGSVTINENSNCPCNPPLATEETTWGRVKALYR
jgi:hypothetical protein